MPKKQGTNFFVVKQNEYINKLFDFSIIYRELLAIAKEKNLFLMEAIWSRHFPIYDVIKKEIKSGAIGDVVQVIANFGFRMPNVERLKLINKIITFK